MTRVRLHAKTGGYAGYWVIQIKRKLFGWKTVFESSIYAYGNDGAFREAESVLKRMTKTNG